MPKGQVVSPRRRGYAGNRAARQAFFSCFFGRFLSQNPTNRKAGTVVYLRLSRVFFFEKLIVRKIIRAVLWRRRKHLVALDVSAAMPARNELIVIRVGSDDSGTA
jgi:hypothetical protein